MMMMYIAMYKSVCSCVEVLLGRWESVVVEVVEGSQVSKATLATLDHRDWRVRRASPVCRQRPRREGPRQREWRSRSPEVRSSVPCWRTPWFDLTWCTRMSATGSTCPLRVLCVVRTVHTHSPRTCSGRTTRTSTPGSWWTINTRYMLFGQWSHACHVLGQKKFAER